MVTFDWKAPMFRKYIDDLTRWLNGQNRKPLLVWGARQVGKSYLIKDIFAEEYFKGKYIYVDCRTDHEFVDYCQSHVNVSDVINYLSLDRGMEIKSDTLLIFDEAQECLPIVTLMKYFCQERKEIPVIVTGSMVRIKIQRENRKRGNAKRGQFLFPVGKINQLTIYPLDFEEFLYNENRLLYVAIRDSYVNKTPIDELLHQKALKCFYDYLMLGGMPEVVDVFLKTKSYQTAKETLVDLYDNYLGDMELYQASPESIVRSKKIFENIYTQLNKESKNYKPSLIGENLKSRDLRTPIDWLSLAFLVNKSSLVKERVSIPLVESNESLYRLYLSDMGMFTYQSRVNPKTFLSEEGVNTLSGVFFENYVAVELVNYGYKLFYWKGKNDAEFEFLIENGSSVIPIDVKKTKGKMNSLKKYIEHNKFDYAVKVSKNYYGFDEGARVLTIPFYFLPFYLKELREKERID